MPDAVQSQPLAVDLAGVRLRNPIMLAAGTAGYVDEMAGPVRLERVGGVVTKSITAEPRLGAPTWRILETRRGMLNAIGLANVGADAFERDYAGRAAGAPTTIIGSVAGYSAEEYERVCAVFDRIEAIRAVELNVSCPNVEGGAMFGDAPEMLARLVERVRGVLGETRLFVKLAPIITSAPGWTIVDAARSAVEAGADGLCVANTIPAMAIDVESRRPRLSNVTGGLSGPGTHPVIVRLVRLVYEGAARERGVPVVAIGGAMDWADVAEFILAGASAVQMGAATFADPRAPERAARGLEKWVRRQGAARVSELVGRMESPDPEQAP